MTQRHRYLPLFALKPGMVLGHALVLPERGVAMLNLSAGQELTEAQLTQLRAHHGEYACILEEDERDEALYHQQRDIQEARLVDIFRHANLNQPDIHALFHAVLAYREF